MSQTQSALSSKKKQVEACPKDCKGRILDARRGRYCPCIENKIEQMPRNCLDAARYGKDIEALAEADDQDWHVTGSSQNKRPSKYKKTPPQPIPPPSPYDLLERNEEELTENDIQAKLEVSGASEVEVKIVLTRAFENAPLREIQDKFGCSSPKAADRICKRVAKQAGFKPTSKKTKLPTTVTNKSEPKLVSKTSEPAALMTNPVKFIKRKAG